jgi:acylglycerol lipase
VSCLQFLMASLLSAVTPRCPLVRLHASDMSCDPAVARTYDTDLLVHHGRLDARFVGEAARLIRRLPAQCHRLTLPLLAMHGAADVTANPDGSRTLISEASSTDKTLRVYEGRRHDLLNDAGHAEVMADVVNWLGERR